MKIDTNKRNLRRQSKRGSKLLNRRLINTLIYEIVDLMGKKGFVALLSLLIVFLLSIASISGLWLNAKGKKSEGQVLSAYIKNNLLTQRLTERQESTPTPIPTAVEREVPTRTPITPTEAVREAPTRTPAPTSIPTPEERQRTTTYSIPVLTGSQNSAPTITPTISITPKSSNQVDASFRNMSVSSSSSSSVKVFDALTQRFPISVKKVSTEVINNNEVYVIDAKRSGQLFGFIPVTVNSKIVVNPKNGSILSSSKPWWSFLINFELKKKVEAFVPNVCGNKVCEIAENSNNCLQDCGKFVPNICGNKTCEPGEGPKTCKQDCCGFCGDNKCVGYSCGENSVSCKADCGTACGNSTCDPGENPQVCPADCSIKACGNEKCEIGEGPDICPSDCSTACGDNVCSKGESYKECPTDCGYCGDKVCSSVESSNSCPKDCSPVCGDSKCQYPENSTSCSKDCSVSPSSIDKGICGDNVCDKKDLKQGCALDCGLTCGDGMCAGAENVRSCLVDCPYISPTPVAQNNKYQTTPLYAGGPYCGNSICNKGEDPQSCPLDCGAKLCGDGKCTGGENPKSCSKDCGSVCGNNVCEKGEAYQSCSWDCGTCGDATCSPKEKNVCFQDCNTACGDGICETGESTNSCPNDCTLP